jgi:hypothetical protein
MSIQLPHWNAHVDIIDAIGAILRVNPTRTMDSCAIVALRASCEVIEV